MWGWHEPPTLLRQWISVWLLAPRLVEQKSLQLPPLGQPTHIIFLEWPFWCGRVLGVALTQNGREEGSRVGPQSAHMQSLSSALGVCLVPSSSWVFPS